MIRAVAALAVVVFHIHEASGIRFDHPVLAGLFSAGNRGVDLFFVLSGFIIAYVHVGELGRPERVGRYLFARLARVYPMLWIMSALAVALYAVGYGAADKADKLAPGAVAASLFLLPQQADPLVNVSWTLTYEMFFYALFAVAIVNVRLGVALLVAWQAAVAAVALAGWDLGFRGYYLQAICLEFGVGLACAWYLHRFTAATMPASLWLALLVGGIAGFAAGAWLDTAVGSTVLCGLGAGAIIVALVRLEQAERLRVPRTLVLLGGASYAIYMVHFSVIRLLSAVLKKLGVPPHEMLWLVYLAAGMLAGLAFDRWVDKPIQRRLRRLGGTRPRPAPAAGLSASGA